MDKAKLAEMLNGREYGNEITREEEKQASDAGLVVVYGASDDLMEFAGAIHDEVGCYEGGIAYLDGDGLWANECGDEGCPYAEKEMEKCKTIEVVWDDEKFPSWTYETDIPHAEFNIMEDGEVYCIGIVFEISALK